MGSDPGLPDGRIDVVDLLRSCPAFAGLPRTELSDLAREAKVSSVGAVAEPVSGALVVQRGVLVVRDAEGCPVGLVAQGEFAAPEAGESVGPVEPALVVWLPDRAVDVAWSVSPVETAAAPPSRWRTPLRTHLRSASVRAVMRVPVLTVRPDEPAHAVASRMSQAQVSSVVVLDGARLGIATDRDLRTRLVAHRRSADTPIGELATFPARTVPSDTPVLEAVTQMLTGAVHHLPVTDGTDVVGIVSSGDLLRMFTRSPLSLHSALDNAPDIATVATALHELPGLVDALLASGTTPGNAGRVVAAVTDRVHHRLLDLAFAELGPPPTPYGWIVFGSQGRREQTLHSDQDHGLVLPDGLGPDLEGWWLRLAGWMVAALAECGFPRCEGGVMAVDRRWRHTVSGWRDTFAAWIARPSEANLLQSAIGFDLRTVAGELDAGELLHPTLETAARSRVFLAHLARDTVSRRPPLNRFGHFAVERSGPHQGTLDIKKGVLLPVADLGRLLALERGGRELTTDARLAAAIAHGQLSPDLGATLRGGYELATGIRLRLHLDQHRRGAPAHNRLDPRTLDPLVRSQLRETFRALRVAQQHLSARFQVSLLG